MVGAACGAVGLAAALWLAGCGPGPGDPAGTRPAATGASAEPRPDLAEEGKPRVIVLGDSLAAGYGLDQELSFPSRLAERLAERGRPVRMVNAGVSGDTTAGGLARLDWVLAQRPDLLIVALGANDGLRGLSPAMTEENLRRIVDRARQAGARVLLAGMRLPPSLGAPYVEAFEAVYPRLAAELGVPLVPFLLEGVGGRPELNLPDGIHPSPEGHRRIADHLLPAVVEALTGLPEAAAADASVGRGPPPAPPVAGE